MMYGAMVDGGEVGMDQLGLKALQLVSPCEEITRLAGD